MTANNQPSCPTPSGWTLAAAQGFESGSLPRDQYLCNGSPRSPEAIESTIFHTGTHAAGGEYSGGDQLNCWTLKGGSINSLETYISWWEYDELNGRLNQDFYMFRRILRGSAGSYIADVTANILPPGPSNCLFNCTSETLAFGPEGSGSQPNYIDYSGNATPGYDADPGFGTWTQWEMLFELNTSGNSDGSVKMWRNGTLVYADLNKDIIGTYTGYETADLQIGGVYTSLVWWLDSAKTQCADGHGPYSSNYSDWSKPDPCSNQAPPTGHIPTFKRYFDDIIVLKK